MAVNFVKRSGEHGQARRGLREGRPLAAARIPRRLGPRPAPRTILGHAVIGTILGSRYPGPGGRADEDRVQAEAGRGRGQGGPAIGGGGIYKARPLNGIWATAPYLHNGSVPTLYQLLLPAKDRPKTLHRRQPGVRPRERRLPDRRAGLPRFRARGDDGKPIPGNSNEGHEFGTELPQREERWALVEYLKSL